MAGPSPSFVFIILLCIRRRDVARVQEFTTSRAWPSCWPTSTGTLA